MEELVSFQPGLCCQCWWFLTATQEVLVASWPLISYLEAGWPRSFLTQNDAPISGKSDQWWSDFLEMRQSPNFDVRKPITWLDWKNLPITIANPGHAFQDGLRVLELITHGKVGTITNISCLDPASSHLVMKVFLRCPGAVLLAYLFRTYIIINLFVCINHNNYGCKRVSEERVCLVKKGQ